MIGNPQSKRLVVLQGENWIEFFFEGDEQKSWRIRNHPEASGWFLVEEFVDGWYSSEFYDSYENAGVQDLRDLYEILIKDPERTLEGLFGERIPISEVA
jgi:hypothetical protein